MSCTKYSIKKVDKDFLQGTWKTFFNPNVVYFAETNYTLTFKEDSFKLIDNYFTDVMSIDTCVQHSYTNYSYGVYNLQAKRIEFNGKYSNNTFTAENTDTCRKIGNFYENGDIYKKGDTLFIKLDNNQYHNFKDYMKLLKE